MDASSSAAGASGPAASGAPVKVHSVRGKRPVADSPMTIVADKFKQSERVLAIFDAYQQIGYENPNRLLALVKSTGTYAIFSFAISRSPPETLSDLTIDNVFPINEYFKFEFDAITNQQFDLLTTGLKLTFHYYPLSAFSKDFDTFHSQIVAAMKEFKSNATSVTSDCSFAWLRSYSKEEDFTDIDPNIADGTKPLRKSESKFQDELKKREHEYIVYKDYKIYCATWNINGQPCRETSLREWLSACDDPPDIYAIGLQELVLSATAIAFSDSRLDPVWIRRMAESLHEGAVYDELTSVRLVGMMLTIFVRAELRQNVTRCDVQSVGTGALNLMGNKGGVGVSLTFNEADICFMNAHLAAHLNEVERRNEDYATIMQRCVFDASVLKLGITQHDHIFWIGDLNYRINEFPGLKTDYDDIRDMYKYDQLRSEMMKRRVLQGFTEGEITFRPTYKYDPGTDTYDSSEKNRAPAWCDRILWSGKRIEQLVYNSVMSIRQSDHKPVYGIFSTGIKTIDDKKYKKVHEDVLKLVDKYENDNQPQITVDTTNIDFNLFTFNEVYVREFTVANKHHLPVNFSFKPKDEDKRKICKKWLSVEPQSGTLRTGNSLSIRIKLFLNSRYVADLLNDVNNAYETQKVTLDILVLDVENGCHIFIPIEGSYKLSCFGLSVDTLCRTDRPISDYDIKELHTIYDDNEGQVNLNHEYKVTMPREIFFLLDYIHNNIKNSGSTLFNRDRPNSKSLTLNLIRDWLDTWSKDDFPGTAHTAAEALLMLLEAPNKPLLYPLEEAFLKSESYDKSCELLLGLSVPRRNVFLHLCMFLQDGLTKQFNRNEIATVFGNVLLKGRRQIAGFRDDRCALFMHQFLRNGVESFTRDHVVIN